MASFSKLALPLMGSPVLAFALLSGHVARAQSSPPPLIGEEIRHAQNDFASGGVRRLTSGWYGCLDQAETSQDANVAARCVVYGYSALRLGNTGANADGTPWMRHLTADMVAPGQLEMAAIMGIPEGPRQAWLDRYQRWVSQSFTADVDVQSAGDATPNAPERGTWYGGAPYAGTANDPGGAPYGGGQSSGPTSQYGGPGYGGGRYGGAPGDGTPHVGAPDNPDGGLYGGGRSSGPVVHYGGTQYGDAPYNRGRNLGAPVGSASGGGDPAAPYSPDGAQHGVGRSNGGTQYAAGQYGDGRHGGSPGGGDSYGGTRGGDDPNGGVSRPTVADGAVPFGTELYGGRHGVQPGQADLARIADGKYPRDAMREPDIAGALHQLVGPEVFSHLKNYSFASPMAFTGRYTVGSACEPHACGISEARLVVSPDAVWIGIIKGGRMRIFGNPPRPVRTLLLRDRNQTAWRGIVEDVTRPMPPQIIQASVDSTSYGPLPRLTIGPHPLPVAAEPAPGSRPGGDATEVRLHNREGTFEVPVTINGTMTLPFAIDSGSSDVSVSSGVLEKLAQAGTVSRADMLGRQTYHLADGSSVSNETFRIHVLKVGDREVRDVLASVTNDADGLLLGQTFLNRFRSWSIDNQRQVLVLQ